MNRWMSLFLFMMLRELLDAQCSFYFKSDSIPHNIFFYNLAINAEDEICVMENVSDSSYLTKLDQCGKLLDRKLITNSTKVLFVKDIDVFNHYQYGNRMSINNFNFIAYDSDLDKHFLINSDYNLNFSAFNEISSSAINGQFIDDDILFSLSGDGKSFKYYNTLAQVVLSDTIPNLILDPVKLRKVKMDNADSTVYVLCVIQDTQYLYKFEKKFKSLLWSFKDTCQGSYMNDMIINEDGLLVVGNTCSKVSEYEPCVWEFDKNGQLKSTKLIKSGVKFRRPTIDKIVKTETAYYLIGSRTYRLQDRAQFFFTKLDKSMNVLWDIDYVAAKDKLTTPTSVVATHVIEASDGGIICAGVGNTSKPGLPLFYESYIIKVSSDGKITSLGDKLKSDPKQKVVEQYNSDHLILNNDLMFKRYRMINYAGQEIQSGVVSDAIDISRLHSGYYFIQVIDEQYRVVGAEGFVVE